MDHRLRKLAHCKKCNAPLYGDWAGPLGHNCPVEAKEEKVIMTVEERRELVRRVWERAQKTVCGKCGDLWCGHNPDSIEVDDWIKEQGL